jgi:hypothetical protein
MRSNKAKRNSHGGLKIALAAVGVLLLLPVGWGIFVAIRAVSQGGLAELASISFLPDTHEKLIADFFEVQERQMLKFLDAEKIDQAYVDDLKASAAAQQRTAERLLLRAVKLDAASRKQHEAFTQQSKELNDRYQDRARERSLSLTPVEQQLLNSAFDRENNKDAMLFAVAVSAFMARGLFELPPPDGEREQVYFDEAKVIRDYLQELANVNSTRSLSAASERIEALADRVAEVAADRAAMPSGLDFVNKEYEMADRAFDVTRDALLRRIERDFDSNRSFDDALANFASARDLISRASMGASPEKLRDALADVRQSRSMAASVESDGGQSSATAPKTPTSAAAAEPAEKVAVRPRVVQPIDKPATQPQTPPAMTSQPPRSSVASTAPDSTATRPGMADSDRDSSNNGSNEDAPEILVAPGFGPPGRFGPGVPFGPSGRFGPGARSDANSAGPRFGPGYRSGGPMGPAGPYGNGSRQNAFEEHLKRFDGPTGVKIVVNTSDNGSRFLKSVAAKLGIREHLFQSSGGKTTIAIRYSGSLEEVEQAIDFGTVISTDKAKREIQVDATQ